MLTFMTASVNPDLSQTKQSTQARTQIEKATLRTAIRLAAKEYIQVDYTTGGK